ncbi:MAG TPA: dihydropteroate synthase [Acidimicrobiales bacterium]|nr:dihydropteroate synthase [Acidimicrobiales bacterium]
MLGDHTYELATRTLVMGVVRGNSCVLDATSMVSDGADLLELRAGDANQVVGVVEVPLVTRWHAEVAGAGVSRIVTHVGPGTVEEVRDHLVACAHKFEKAGTPTTSIVVDPGLDRHKTPEQRTAILRRTEDLAALGYPLLMANDSPAEAGWAVSHGCRILRTHDVKGMRRVADVIAAILEAK